MQEKDYDRDAKKLQDCTHNDGELLKEDSKLGGSATVEDSIICLWM